MTLNNSLKSYLFLLFLLLFFQAQTYSQQAFIPKDGDRIVLLGNGLIENEQHYGFLEYRLTGFWPEKQLSFRNLGWSGDTVFGEARSYYTNPPSPYDLLISQIKAAKPDWIIIGYGNVEAQDGAEGLNHFKAGLNQLLDSVASMAVKPILLSTIPQAISGSDELLAKRNEAFLLYNQAIAEIAENRSLGYVDIFKAFNTNDQMKHYENNGVHLNESGYLLLADTLLEQLKLTTQIPSFTIDASSGAIESNVATDNFTITDKSKGFSFNSTLHATSSPVAKSQSEGQKITANGLKKGTYTLSIEGKLQAVGSRKEWEEGIALVNGPSLQQSQQLLKLIREKDKIYFQQYRPQNRTYILGFRSHEQGRHKEGLAALDALIYWMDDQINQTKKPINAQYLMERLP
ncbi:SGNH/GDSL hydrolase family protein [uncultured Cyclobacterium sp.]|uniref:SGNH/GDSL hydrolase family protein n=1 Tax=uncultured Cyclobacterium sp. TaxID=453820 RepID=UPI0030EF909C|tara:strand:+ start:13255 stop:14460 length:1206 start_codon:yes stop_codon:yes gene_type:complete